MSAMFDPSVSFSEFAERSLPVSETFETCLVRTRWVKIC